MKNGSNGSFVCMIAYTDYRFDGRVRREAETLASRGFDVLCLTTKIGPERRRFLLNGVEVRELGVSKYRGKRAGAYISSYLLFMVACSAVCLRLLLRGKLDVLHVHNLPDFLVLAGLLPRLAGTKVVLDVHDSMPETFATKFSDASMIHKALCLEERLSAAIAHKVICVNHPQRERLMARGIPGSKTFISMNVPDPAIFACPSDGGQPAAVAHVDASGGTVNLVYHGTMAERLGVDLVIQAVAKLRGRLPNVRLHLWGTGDDVSRFQALAQELRMDGTVLFNPKGFPLQELPQHLRSMDLGVVGNRRTAAGELMLPVKLMEYVSLGIPAVVPRLKAIEYYFSDDMVAYYEPENVGSLADSLYRLCCSPEQRRAQATHARRFLVEYGWDRQGPELVTLYQQLLEN